MKKINNKNERRKDFVEFFIHSSSLFDFPLKNIYVDQTIQQQLCTRTVTRTTASKQAEVPENSI
jgi:hypothetical protein